MMLDDSNYLLKTVSSKVDGLYRSLCWLRNWWGHIRTVCWERRSHTPRRSMGGCRLCTSDTPKTTRYFQQHKNILWPTMGPSERWWSLMVATSTSCNDPRSSPSCLQTLPRNTPSKRSYIYQHATFTTIPVLEIESETDCKIEYHAKPATSMGSS